jgi:hypothetical protein
MVAAYLDGMRKLSALGGLAFVGLHTQIAGTPGQIGVVGTVLDTVRVQADTWWVATGADIAGWWLDRHAIRLSLTEAAEELRLELRAPRGSGGREVWVDVTLPDAERVPFDGDRPLPYARSDWGIRVPLPALAPGESRTLRLLRPDSLPPGSLPAAPADETR